MIARLEIDGLKLNLGGHPVLRGIDLTLRAGELVGLIGPNGAGKSTLLGAIAGRLEPVQGRIRIDGIEVAQDLLTARKHLGVAVEPERLPPLLSGRQCLELVVDVRNAAGSIKDSLRLAKALGLAPWMERRVLEYSLGTRQKLATLLALVGSPELLVLDEVLNGLDPLAAWALKQELRNRADAGASILLATHGLEVAERFLDRALLLLDGQIAADWDADSLARFRADPEGGLEHAVVEILRQRPL